MVFHPADYLIHEFECGCMLTKSRVGVSFVQCFGHYISKHRILRGLIRP